MVNSGRTRSNFHHLTGHDRFAFGGCLPKLLLPRLCLLVRVGFTIPAAARSKAKRTEHFASAGPIRCALTNGPRNTPNSDTAGHVGM